MLFCYFMYSIGGIYGFEMLPDEFGYWSYAAGLSGYDWSDIVSVGSYYSFGYTLILYPIFRLCGDPVTAYRAAVAVNFVLMAAACLALTKLLVWIFGEEMQYAPLVAAIAIFYPPWLFYARMTMTEIVVMCLYVVICVLMYLYLENRKPWVLFLLALSLVYIYTVHMRTVGILIAAAVTLIVHICMHLCMKKKHIGKKRSIKIALVILAGILLVLAANGIKRHIAGQLYVTQEAKETFSTNDYSGQIDKIMAVFTWEGFQNLLVSLAGKILYLGMASFGLFYWGIKLCVEKLVKEKKLFYLFILLATAGEIGIAAIYTSGGERVDSLTYGRYTEQMLPVLMALGCMAVMEAKSVVKPTLAVAALQLPLLGIVVYAVRQSGWTNIHAYMIAGISYLFDKDTFDPISFYVRAYLMAMVLTVAVTALLRLTRRRKMHSFLFVVLVLELVLGMRLASVFSEKTQLANFRDVQLTNIIQEELDGHEKLVYLQEGDRAFAGNIQFQLREEKLWLERDAGNLTAEDFVVTDYLYSGMDTLKEQYTNWRVMGHYAIFYN